MTVEQLMAILQQADPDAWVELEVEGFYSPCALGLPRSPFTDTTPSPS